ncbi:MAG: helix-turn-helix domain-containing protein [Bacteroidetes bacterium]|nr:helix-turn-helix domain-containing protein [Bacteroidota bacterium]
MEIKSTFIQLRAHGLAINDIAEKLGIHRTTLIQWNKDFYADIKIAEQNEYDKILLAARADKMRRIRFLGEMLADCYDAFERQDEQKTDKLSLLNLIEKLTKMLHKETGEHKLNSLLKKSEKGVGSSDIIATDEEVYNKLNEEFIAREEKEDKDYENEVYMSRLEKMNDEFESKTPESEDAQNFIENLINEETEFFSSLRNQCKERLDKLEDEPEVKNKSADKKQVRQKNKTKGISKSASA